MNIQTHHVKSPVKITHTKLEIPSDYRKKCINEIYNIGDQQEKGTNLNAAMSWWMIWDLTSVFNPLLKKVLETVNHCYPLNWKSSATDHMKYYMTNAWTAIYKDNDFAINHGHEPAYIAWVYYFQSESDTPIVFSECDFKIYPESDTLVMFPASLIHSVPKHKSSTDRLILAGNIEAAYTDARWDRFQSKVHQPFSL